MSMGTNGPGMHRRPWAGIRHFLGVAAIGTGVPCAVGAEEPGTVEAPISIRSGHVQVDVMLDGKGPFHVVFDSGGSNVLTPEAAGRLGVPIRGTIVATGTGGEQAARTATVASVRLGGVTLSNQSFLVLALPPSTSDDAPVDGLIGFEWLSRFPIRLDYAGGRLILYVGKDARPDAATPPARLFFRGRMPQIDAKVDGIAGRFSIDTGSAASLTLSTPFVAVNALATRYHAKTRVMSGRGIGGPAYALAARAESLDLGVARVDRPVTFLSQQTTGAYARTDTAGNIGFGVLRQFTILFDYPHKRIFLEPNTLWGQPDLADRSGLRLERMDGALSVAFVAEGSPAAIAGLKAGDRIVSIGEAPAATLMLDDVRRQLKGPVGTRILMTSDRSPIAMILADL